jgi:hypothetical protein
VSSLGPRYIDLWLFFWFLKIILLGSFCYVHQRGGLPWKGNVWVAHCSYGSWGCITSHGPLMGTFCRQQYYPCKEVALLAQSSLSP